MSENLSADVTTGEVVEYEGGPSVQRANASTISDAVAKVNSLGNAEELGVYSSIDGSTFEGRVATLAALTDSVPAADHLNEDFSLKDVVVQAITLTNKNDKTGELEEDVALRVILVTDIGNLHAVSNGLFRSIQNIIGTLGHPSTWPTSVKAKVVEERGRSGFRFMTLKVNLSA